MKYNVLWIDDEWEKRKAFIKLAKTENIVIFPFSTAAKGMEELEAKIDFFDAVILDAKGWDESSDEVASTKGMYSAIRKLNELKTTRVIPYFIFTGQPDLYSNQVFTDSIEKGKYYNKGNIESIEELFRDIKLAADRHPETQVHHKYEKALKTFELIGANEMQSLFDILMAIEGYKDINHEVYYTPIRKIVEQIFRHAHKIGLLHNKCVDNQGKINLSESSLFLSGQDTKHSGVKCAKSHFPKIIANNIKNLIWLTGGASHTAQQDAKDTINLHDYWQSVNTPYLLYAQTLILCDILIWYKDYASQNPDHDTNSSFWDDILTFTGIVEKDEDGKYHCGEYLLKAEDGKTYVKNHIKIKVNATSRNTNPTSKDTYPYFAPRSAICQK